jgi:hypothetical protein
MKVLCRKSYTLIGIDVDCGVVLPVYERTLLGQDYAIYENRD